jgi:lipopolysaccharide transport system permease protein
MEGIQALPLDQPTYILSGLIPWLAFSDSMSKGSTAITSAANLVKQVIFPIEILPVKGVLACFVTQLIGTLFLILYVLISYHTLYLSYFLLIPLLFMQLLAMIGVSYVFSSVGVYFKDLKDFVGIFLTAGLFLAPILYHPGMVPKSVAPLLSLNPFSHMVWCYQDAFFFGGFEHPWSWVVFSCFSLIAFYFGYRVFRKLKLMFGNVL